MKIKKLMSLLAATAMAVTALTGAMSVSASEVANGTCGEGITWTLDSEGVLTLSGEGEMASPDVSLVHGQTISIETLKSYPSDYSNIYAYKEYAEDIKEVVIEEGVTSIGFCAFYQMPNLETVVLPSTISEFKGLGFNSCYHGANTGPNQAVEAHAYASFAFAECAKLKNLTLTEGMKAIGSFAFYGCTALEGVRIPTTILEDRSQNSLNWGVYSFSQCSNLKNITLPEGLKVIGSHAFTDTAVESVVIPSTITTWNIADTLVPMDATIDNRVQSSAFANCTNLTSVTLKDGIKTLVKSPFYNCPKLTKVSIPASVTDMRHAFAYCNSLQEAYIEDGAQIIAEDPGNKYFDQSFFYCENLHKLEIPEGVSITYNNAEWCKGCSSLQDIYLHGKNYGSYIPTVSDYSRFHCYIDSTTYKTLTGQYLNNLPSDRVLNIEEAISNAKNTLNKKLEDARALNESDYTAESYAALKTAIDNAEKFDENSTQILPMQWAASDITSATRKLEKKPEPADYTAVDAALAKIPSDLSIYTDESVEALNDAKEAVVRDLTIDEQERVNGFANAIEEAIAGLIKKPNSNTGSDNPQNPNQNNNTNKPNQPTSSKDKGKTPTNKVTVPKPAQVKSVKATAKKKKLNVSWKKVSGATGYEVMYATNNKFTKGKKTVKVKKNKVTLKRLKSKKKYFVKVRAYKKLKGNVSYGKWSKVVKKKVK